MTTNKTIITYEDGSTHEYDFKGEITVEDKNSIENFDDVVSVNIGLDVTCLGKGIFDHEENLSSVVFPESLRIIREKAFYFSGIRRIDIPESVETIEKWAFSCCENMKVLTLPSSLTSMGESSFDGAIKIKKLVIPTGLTKIPAYAFDHCESLSSLTLHNDITEIGEAAFRCSKITHLALPLKLVSLGDFAFAHNNRLKEIEYKGIGYTSLKKLTDALIRDGASLGNDVFGNTALGK